MSEINVKYCCYYSTRGTEKDAFCLCPRISANEYEIVTESVVCADNSNCYYKQLKQKEQEITKIEKVIAPYQEPIEPDAFNLVGAIRSILERNIVNLKNNTKAFKQIKLKLEHSLDPDKTNSEQSIDKLYETLDIIEDVLRSL